MKNFIKSAILISAIAAVQIASTQVHFSQLDSRWNWKVMSPSSYTLGNSGCVEDCVAMTLAMSGVSVDPGILNDWGVTRGLYTSGGLLVWSVATAYDGPGGVQYVGASTATASNLKTAIDAGRVAITYSRRGCTGHWVLIFGYENGGGSMGDFKYLDPLDLSPTIRRAGDGLVVEGASTRILQRPTGSGSATLIDNFQQGYAEGYRQFGWRTINGLGLGGSMRTTRNNNGHGEDAWASWTFRSSVSSVYNFDAFISRFYGSTRAATYRVYRNNVHIATVQVNQRNVSDAFTRIYSAYVPAGWELKIVLIDITGAGEAYNTVDICADTMRMSRP